VSPTAATRVCQVPAPRDLTVIFKAYDVRGIVPDQLDAQVARAAGAAFVTVLGVDRLVTAYDMRESSPVLAAAFAEGATQAGADVVATGLGSTDLLYFASGSLGLAGAMFTASHNPAQYNGIKMCRPGAAPVGQDTGLTQIRDLTATYLAQGIPAGARTGSVTQQDLLGAYADYLHGLVDLGASRPLRVVVDAGNGMGGFTVPAVLGGTGDPITVLPMYFELDGSFPHHEANPIDPANLVDLVAKVRETGADAGLAFDGDADRCFVVDETGAIVDPSTVTALVATRELAKHPGATIIYNLISSRAVPDIVREQGGTPVRTRVGHSFIKAEMARTGAVFGGEHSGHFYFAGFWNADSGMLAALHVLAALGASPDPLSQVLAPYDRYVSSGEINSEVADQAGRVAAIETRYASRASLDHLDGLTIDAWDAEGWWANVRASNTEPLLRLNVEARDRATMGPIRDELLSNIRQEA
jgi:phosphomannomutase